MKKYFFAFVIVICLNSYAIVPVIQKNSDWCAYACKEALTFIPQCVTAEMAWGYMIPWENPCGCCEPFEPGCEDNDIECPGLTNMTWSSAALIMDAVETPYNIYTPDLGGENGDPHYLSYLSGFSSSGNLMYHMVVFYALQEYELSIPYMKIHVMDPKFGIYEDKEFYVEHQIKVFRPLYSY